MSATKTSARGSMGSVEFFVHGRPAPKGSWRKGRAGQIVPASVYLRDWTIAVAERAKIHARAGTIHAPAMIRLDFLLERPRDQRRPDGTLRASSIGAYPKRPDIDKLIRSTLDALVSAELLADDSQIVELHASKRYSTTRSGVGIGIWPVLP